MIPAEDLDGYLARRLTEVLGAPDRTGSGQHVWVCRLGGEPALVTIYRQSPGKPPMLRVLQAPEASTVEVCALKYIEAPTREAADNAVAQLTRDCPPG